MDGNLIKAYLSGEEVGGTPKFEQLFTNHLAENVHISKPDPTFFAMMFLGFNNILAMQSIRSEYMIEASYFGWYSKFNAVKALILVNDGGKTSIKTRTIFLKEIPNEAPRLLLRKEFAEMSVQLAEHWLELLLYNKYQEDLRDGIVEEGTTFESYQRPAIDVGHFHECCYSAYDSLKLYAVENKEYHLEELKGEPGTETSRSHFFLKEIFNSVNVKKNRGTNVPNNHELNIKQLQRQFIDFGQDRIILQDTNLLYVESPENILAAYKSIYEADFSVVGDISNVGDFLSVSSKLYTRQTEKMALLDRGSESTKCGYVLGLSMALKHIRDFPPNVKALQYTTTELENNDGSGPRKAFFLVLEPGFHTNINLMAEKIPIIITFSVDHEVTPEMYDACHIKNKIHSQFFLLKTDFYTDRLMIKRISVPKTNNFIEQIKMVTELEEADVQQELKLTLDELFNEIQPVKIEQKLTDVTYLSRYIFGASLAAERTTEGLTVQEMRPSEVGSLETSYVISWPEKGTDVASSRKHIILNFVEHVDAENFVDHRSEPTENFDTLFVHITQNFKTSPNDPHVGNIDRSINVHQAYFETFERNTVLQPIGHVSADELRTGTTSIQSFHTDLRNALRTYDHLIKEPSLPGKQHLVESSSNFRAVIDGIFHRQPSMKNIIRIPRYLSSVQYTVPVEIPAEQMDANGEDGHNTQRTSLLTLNFKYTADEKVDLQDLSRGVMLMEEEISGITKDNIIVNSYFVGGSNLAGDPDDLTITKHIQSCNARRRRRGSPVACGGKNTETNVDVNDKFEKPKITGAAQQRLEILNDVASVCHYAGLSIMVRDLISDVYHGNKLNVLKDTGFLVTTALSPRLGSYLINKGGAMIANEMKVSGYATKALGFGVSRAISLYVFYDFIKNAVDYAKNPNDTSAEVNMAVDGAFVAIDAIVLGIEGLAAAGLISGGIAAIANPIGSIIGTALIIGLNVYQTVETVKNIAKFVTLNDRELVDESLRAFFRIDPAPNIQELIYEEQANEYLKDQATGFFMQYRNHFDVFIRKSGIVQGKSIKVKENAIIDLQHKQNVNISRASPKSDAEVNVICALHEEAEEIQSPTIWTKVEGFFTEIGHSFKLFYHVLMQSDLDVIVKDAIDEKLDGQIRDYGYVCHNSFGLQLRNSTRNKAAYFDLGDGNDVISGLLNKSNSFHLGSGSKYINGSNRNDFFILEHLDIRGILDGSAGQDTVDISGINSSDTFHLFSGRNANNSVLTLNNIETVIGRFKMPETVVCGCSFRTVRTQGGRKDKPDFIIATDHTCAYDVTLYLDDYTKVLINQVRGNFTHLVYMKQQSAVELLIEETEQSVATHTMIINHSFLSLEKITSTTRDVFFISEFLFENGSNLNISRSSNESMSMYFNDGCQVVLSSGKIKSAFLYSNVSIKKMSLLYGEKVRQLGISSLTAYSTIKNETIVISGKTDLGPNIIHNSLFNPTNLYIDNCGNSLLLVNATYSEDELLFPTINVHLTNCSCCSLTIDFNLIIQHIEEIGESENVDLLATFYGDNLSLAVSRRSTSSTLEAHIGQIIIADALKDQCYKNITIRSYNDLFVFSDKNRDKRVDRALLNSAELNEQVEDYFYNLL